MHCLSLHRFRYGYNMRRGLTILFTFAIYLGFGQNRLKDIDILKYALDTAKLESTRVIIKINLADLYALVNIDSAFIYSQNALTISRQISFTEGEARALDALGWIFHNTSNHALSLDMYFKSLKFAEKNNFPDVKGAGLMMTGLTYKDEYGDLNKALNYIYGAKFLFDSIHHNRNSTVCEALIGAIYIQKHQLDSADFYLQLAQSHEAQYNLNYNYVIWGYFGLLNKAKGDYVKALDYSKQAAKLACYNGDFANCSGFNIQVAETYVSLNQRDSAIYYATMALNESNKSKLNGYTIKTGTILYNSYKNIDLKKALYYKEITSSAADSIYKSAKSYSLNNVIDFEEKDRKYEIETTQKAYQNQIRLYVLLSSLAFFLIIAFILYKNNRQKQKANSKLQNTLEELESTQKQLIEKEKIATFSATRLQELDAVKARLYTNITHEFRTPLTVILGITDNLVDRNVETKHALSEKDWETRYAMSLQMIIRNGRNLLTLVNQLLDLSKLESGNLNLNYQQGDIVGFIKYVTESFHSLAESKGLVINYYSEFDNLAMEFDEIRLQQVVSNLISNALKFTNGNGKIDISLENSNHVGFQNLRGSTNLRGVSLKVKDNGIGMTESELPHVFDRFYQADTSSARQGEGTGIGLALTQELVKLMNGVIAVSSVVGEGTEFTVELPITRRDNSSTLSPEKILTIAGDNATTLSPTQLKRDIEISFKGDKAVPLFLPTILIADDNGDVRAYITLCLSNDYNLLIAKDGQECETLAFENTPDLIISDVMMPLKDGFEVCKNLKNDERTSHIPIIMLTAKADVESKLLGLAHGADVYLMKPFHKEELLMRIKKLLELRQQLQKHYLSALSRDALNASQNNASENTSDALNASQKTQETHSMRLYDLQNAFVIKVKTVVEAHLTDSKFDVEVLERALNLSHSQLHRKLTAVTGLSANSFIRSIKLIKAKELLLHSPYSIQAIAYDSGFNDQAYFSRVFKQEFGETPQAWRERNTV